MGTVVCGEGSCTDTKVEIIKDPKWPLNGSKDCSTALVTAGYVVARCAVTAARPTVQPKTCGRVACCTACWAASCPASPPSSSGRRPGRGTTLRGTLEEMLEHQCAAQPASCARRLSRSRRGGTALNRDGGQGQDQ